MTRLLYSAEALSEMSALTDHFLAISPELAQRFSLKLTRLFERIEATPQLYQARKNGVRVVSLPPPFREYFTAYRLREDNIEIIVLGHAKRRPLYFMNRIP